MAVNKVIYAGDTLIDLTGDTVTPETLAEGVTAHDASGAAIVGTMTGGSGEENQLHDFLDDTLAVLDSPATKIRAHCCRGLSELKTVNLPNATSIGTYAFYSCEAMAEFYAPNVVTLGTYAFYSCEALLSINFPLVTSIPANCFYACRSAVKIDCGVAGSIAANAFAYCEAMKSLILRKTSAICTLANTSVFRSTPIADGTGYIYVPAALLEEEYKVATNWSTYADRFRALEDYTVDGTITGELDETKI